MLNVLLKLSHNFMNSISEIKMVVLTTAKKWGFKEFIFTCRDKDDPSKVPKIHCVVCKEFYSENLKLFFILVQSLV